MVLPFSLNGTAVLFKWYLGMDTGCASIRSVHIYLPVMCELHRNFVFLLSE